MSVLNAFADYKYDGKQLPMEEIRVLHLAVGTKVPAILNATLKIFTPGLVENKEIIEYIEPVTETYGSHDRHKLDIYQAKGDNAATGPILIFLYGGGLVSGDKILSNVAKGLVYWNLGTFFASRGITTIIPDYRRVDSKSGGEGAIFPSGGEDISLVFKWLESSKLLGNTKRDVYILGNSAGAVHTSTFLFEPSFLQQRQGYFSQGGYLQSAKEYVSSGSGISLKGVVLLGFPADFENVGKDRKDMLEAYYGNSTSIEEQAPSGLIRALARDSSPAKSGIPKILALVGEYDPHDEIVKPMEDFVELFQSSWPDYNGIELKTLEGHNHISPPVALMSGDERGEEWGIDVVKWILGHDVEVPKEATTIKRLPNLNKAVDEDESTVDAKEEDEKHGNAKGVDLPTEDSSTGSVRKNKRTVNPSEDYSTEKEDKRTLNPTKDHSTAGSSGKEHQKPQDPTKDYSTQAGDNKPQNPAEDDAGKELE